MADKQRLAVDDTVTSQTLGRAGVDFIDPLTFVASDARSFVKTLVNKPVKVQFLTQRDFAGATDGQTIWLDGNLAQDESIPLTVRADIIKGALLDELGHIQWTKFNPSQCAVMYARRHDQSLPFVPNLFKGINNLVEDHYIVRKLLRRFPGFIKTHFTTVKYYMNVEERVAEYRNEIQQNGVPSLKSVVTMLIVMVKGSVRLQGATGLNSIADEFDRVHKLHKHEDRIELAIELTDLLVKTYENEPESTVEQGPEPTQSPAATDEDEVEPDFNDSATDDESAEVEVVQVDPNEFGGEDEAEDWDEDEDENENETQTVASDSADDSADDEVPGSDSADDEDDDEDEDEDWDEDADADAFDDEDWGEDDEAENWDEPEIIDSDEDWDDELDEMDDDPSAAESIHSDGSGDEDAEGAEGSDLPGEELNPDGTEANEGTGSGDDDDYRPTHKDIEDQDADLDDPVLLNAGVGETTAMDGTDPTRQKDTTERVQVSREVILGSAMRVTRNPDPVNKKGKKMAKWDRQVARQMSKRLTLTADDEGGWTHGYRSGRILARDIVKVARGSRTPASRFNSRQMPNLSVAILQDASGSISEQSHALICRLCDILVEGMDSANNGLKVWHIAYEGNNLTVTKEPGKVRKVSSRQASNPGGGTPTVEAIYKAKALMDQADVTARKLIVVLTDGSPNGVQMPDGSYASGNAAIHTFNQENRDVDLMQILINAHRGADIQHTVKVWNLDENTIARLVGTLNAVIKQTRRQRQK